MRLPVELPAQNRSVPMREGGHIQVENARHDGACMSGPFHPGMSLHGVGEKKSRLLAEIQYQISSKIISTSSVKGSAAELCSSTRFFREK